MCMLPIGTRMSIDATEPFENMYKNVQNLMTLVNGPKFDNKNSFGFMHVCLLR